MKMYSNFKHFQVFNNVFHTLWKTVFQKIQDFPAASSFVNTWKWFFFFSQGNTPMYPCLSTFFFLKEKGTCTFLVQNKKSTKRNLQAFRLTEAQILYLSEIGSPHGFSRNEFIEPSGTSRRNRADRQKHQILFVTALQRRSASAFFTEREHVCGKPISPT